jgi:hypothetical protein
MTVTTAVAPSYVIWLYFHEFFGLESVLFENEPCGASLEASTALE